MNEVNTQNELSAIVISGEYEYIATSVFQNSEDRARVSSFFVVVIGTFLAMLFSEQLRAVDSDIYYQIFGVAFALIFILGTLSVLQLARLRLAWIDSVKALNQIKAEAVKNDPSLEAYFRWGADSMPRRFKLRSFSFLQAVIVAVLSGFAAGASLAMFWLAGHPAKIPWVASVILGIVALIFVLIAYRYWLEIGRDEPESEDNSPTEKSENT